MAKGRWELLGLQGRQCRCRYRGRDRDKDRDWDSYRDRDRVVETGFLGEFSPSTSCKSRGSTSRRINVGMGNQENVFGLSW